MPADAPPAALDSQAFARDNGRLSGTSRLVHYPRLLVETQGQGADRTLGWAAEGSLRADASSAGQAWLHLQISASLPLTCQRCLESLDWEPVVDRWFRFVDTEALAAEQDDTVEEDLLVSSRQFSLAELIEDELLMALPLVPRHEACPGELKMAVADPGFEAPESQPPHPFASLARLRRGPD